MPQLLRPCPGCDTPLAGGTRCCTACGIETSGADYGAALDAGEDPGIELERVRRALAGRYAVEQVVGAGGMAVVYLAEDLRHRRKVAVKVLRSEIAALVGSARFLREIEIAARLQHPRILPVYDSGEASVPGGEGGRLLYYVMPFAGESLASRLARGPVPVADAVRILSQVADALAYAHGQGVVHRDIKPDNVLLTGRHAMVADFGIAKALSVPSAQPSSRTRPGVPIGTPHYMAPEQVAGDPEVDGRADQYAIGVVAYEMLAGRRPFGGGTVQEVLAAQLLDTPAPLDHVRADVPPTLAQVVMRCLEKEPARRWQRSEELAERLEAAAWALGSVTPPEEVLGSAPGRIRPRRLRGLAAMAMTAVVALALGLGRPAREPPIPPMSDQISFDGAIGISAISPDGRLLAFSSRQDGTLRLQELDGGSPVEIARGLTHVLALRWSPDGSRLLTSGWYEGEPGVYVVPRLGGAPRRIRHARLGQWHPSGSRISVWDYPDKSILLVDLESGDSSRVALPGSYNWLYDSEWSPSGDRLAYVTMSEPDRFALHIVGKGLEGGRIVLQDTVPIGSPRWDPEERALYYLSGGAELRKLTLGRSSGAARAEPVTLLDGMQVAPSEVVGVAVPFTMTPDARRLVYVKSLAYSNVWLVASDRVGRAGDSLPARRLTTGTAPRRGVAVSPDGKWIAFLESAKEGTDLYRMPLRGGDAQRLTFSGRVASEKPAWSPDGTHLAFGTYHEGAIRVAIIDAAGGPVRIFPETSLPAMGDVAWAPHRRIMHQVAGNRNYRLLDPLTGHRGWLVSDEAKGWVFTARPSPDGERVAVHWNRRPLGGIWAFSLPDASHELLMEGRYDPVGWSADGRSLYAVGWDSAGIVRVDSEGRVRTLGTLPFRNADCDSADRAGRGTLVCVVPEQVSDVWMVAGFDPERR